MTNPTVHTCCPHLGLDIDRTVILDEPTPDHRCYIQKLPSVPDFARQETFCISSNHVNCSLYVPARTQNITLEATSGVASKSLKPPSHSKKAHNRLNNWRTVLILVSISLTVCLLLVNIYTHLLGIRPSNALPLQEVDPTATSTSVLPTATSASSTPAVAVAIIITPTFTPVPTLTPTAMPKDTSGRFVTPTPEPGGQVFLLGPKAGNAGWWKGEDTQRNHLDDSFLYAGAYDGQPFISAVRFDLSLIPRGAPIRQAQLRLTGLRQDQVPADATGTWLIQLVPESSLEILNPADFLTMLSAPAAMTLFPTLNAADLGTARVNQWELDETTRQWLENQLVDGATSVTMRIQASIEQGEALFAWDSGLGPETKGDTPVLLLSIGAPPPTPPALPTKPVIVATLTPVPKNVLTVVAQAQTATAVAFTIGTNTPIPYAIVTPTPFPANLETVQAVARDHQLPPVVLDTPLPNSPAIATRDAQYATAVALTTGTFTPVPTNYVTPMLIPPSPPAENVATEAARVVAATAFASSGAETSTPLPYNAVIALYIYATSTPGNDATAVAEAVIATAGAEVNGTPTPLPWNALIITPMPTLTAIPSPTATPLPLLQSVTEFTPTPTPTTLQNIPETLPDNLRNKILFKTNRDGAETTYALDPSNGALYRINESWVYPLAQKQLAFSADGKHQAMVKEAADHTLQIHTYALEYNLIQQITALTGEDIGIRAINYDPAWSPRGDLIAFVSTNNGNDEVYTVTIDGAVVTQLTNNKFEWDKHPSWSPDGNQIVFFSNRETGRRQLWIMNDDGSDQRNLSSNPFEDWDPIWIH